MATAVLLAEVVFEVAVPAVTPSELPLLLELLLAVEFDEGATELAGCCATVVAGCGVPTFRGPVAGAGAANDEELVRFSGTLTKGCVGADNAESAVMLVGTLRLLGAAKPGLVACVFKAVSVLALKLDASGEAGCHAFVISESGVCVAALVVPELLVGVAIAEFAA